MARRPREDTPGSWHHVVNRAIAKRPYFENRADQRRFLSRLARQVRAGRIEVHAYCLMTTHFHLLVRSPVGELSEAMRRVQNEYSRYFNRLRQRDGPLIRGRYFSKPVKSDAYRRAVVRYIDANPVRAGIVSDCAEYEFASGRAFQRRRIPPWLEPSWIEEFACSFSGSTEFDATAYLATFGPRPDEDRDSLVEVIEARMASARAVDPLDDIVGSTPGEVQSWMRRKAALADGLQVGLPVCGVVGLRTAIECEVELRGEWLVVCAGRPWRGSELAQAALLRSLCGRTWEQTASLTGQTVAFARAAVRSHRQAMVDQEQHRSRVWEVAAAAVERTLAVGRSR